jgi:hypothetical protein
MVCPICITSALVVKAPALVAAAAAAAAAKSASAAKPPLRPQQQQQQQQQPDLRFPRPAMQQLRAAQRKGANE